MKIEPNRIKPDGFGTDQVNTLNMLLHFMQSDELECIVSGSAGTGKTYLLKYFMDHICNVPVCPTAPTHKAVRVIEKVLNRKGKTLQSLHGLRPNTDIANFNIANPQFDPKGIPYIQNYKLVIIDEASMISNDIYKLNLERAKQYKTKILYVGDPLQLQPVQRDKQKSKVFDVKIGYNLTEIMRQEEGNSLLQLFPLIRHDIKYKTDKLLKYIAVNRQSLNNLEGYKLLNSRDFAKDIISHFSLSNMRKNLDFARVIAYTNKRVAEYNNFIRSKVIKNNEKLLTQDDILTAYTTIVDEFNSPVIINSEDYYIENIRDYVNNFDIKTFAVNLKSVFDHRITTTLQIVDHTHSSFKTYYRILNHLHSKAIRSHKSERAKNWVEYYKFKESMLCMVSFTLNEANNNQTVKKDIDYGYAITAHKSQGSTFENVFIDLQDMFYYKDYNGNLRNRPDKDMSNRLAYVAMSRAQNKVIMRL